MVAHFVRVMGVVVAASSLLFGTAHAGTLGVAQVITGNATSGISSSGNPYTHAFNLGTAGNVVINGVTFVGSTTSGAGYTTSNFGNTNGPSNNFGEFPNPGDSVATMLGSFQHGNNDATQQVLTITGLTPGVQYDARIYYREWQPSNRTQLVRFRMKTRQVP